MRSKLGAFTLALLASSALAGAALAQTTNNFPLANQSTNGSETILGNQTDTGTGKTRLVLFPLSQLSSAAQTNMTGAPNSWGALQTYVAGLTVSGGSLKLPITGPACLRVDASGVTSGATTDCPTLNSNTFTGSQTFGGVVTANAGLTASALTVSGTITTSLTGSGAQCLEADATGKVVGTGAVCGGSGSSPGGSSGQVQFNSAGVFTGTSGITVSGGVATLASPVLNTPTINTATLSSPTLTGTVTKPDGSTNTSSLNTFAKTVTSSVAAGGSPAFSWASGVNFGCLRATGSNSFSLGFAASAGAGSCTDVLTWTSTPNATFNYPLTINPAGTVAALIVQSGGTNIFSGSDAGGVPKLVVPSATTLTVGAAGLSGSAVTGLLEIGNGTNGDTSGIVTVATANHATAINGPSVASCAVDVWNTTQFSVCQPLKLFGGGLMPTPSGSALLQFGGGGANAYSNLGLQVASTNGAGNVNFYTDPYSFYAIGHPISFWNLVTTDGVSAEQIILGFESNASDDQAVEIGDLRACDTPLGCVAQLYRLDAIFAPGSVQHWTIVNPGSNYTQATTTGSIVSSGCTAPPSGVNVKVNDALGTVVGVFTTTAGLNCASASVTINSSGAGSGAVVTGTLVSGTTDAMATPTDLWNLSFLDRTGNGSQLGLGMCDITRACLRIGHASNTGRAWETTASLEPVFAMGGQLEFDTANGAGNNGFTGGEQLFDGGSGILFLKKCLGGASNDCLTQDFTAGLKLGFTDEPGYNVSALPAATAGRKTTILDSNAACTFGATPTGGGSTICPVYADGTAWHVG